MKFRMSNFPLVAVAACLFVIGTLFPRTGCAEEAALSELEELVGPVALYPDDLLSIVLPASTVPLQIVEADRWIRQNKGNEKAVPKDSWDDAVKSLINYPDVVAMMNEDLDWTSALGEAVATDQEAVMDAVQSFRRRAEGAGNLKSDDKQTVVVEKEVVKIVQTDPQVIYVPQYQPQTVVVYQSVPVYPTYYPTPYPVYYYPYPPGHHFAAGFFWGVGPTMQFPTHTDDVLGNDAFMIGPAAYAGIMGKWGVVGAFPQHWWNIGGGDGYTSFTATQLFYWFSVGGGYQIGGAPIITYDWASDDSDNAWTIPVNLGVAKTIMIGKLPVKLKFEGIYYAEQPDAFGPHWGLQLTVTPVIPNPFQWRSAGS